MHRTSHLGLSVRGPADQNVTAKLRSRHTCLMTSVFSKLSLIPLQFVNFPFSREVPQTAQFEENVASLSRHPRPTATSPEVQFALVTLFIPGSPSPDQRILGHHLSKRTARGSRGSLPLPDRGSSRPRGHCFAGGAPRRAHISATGGRTRLERETSGQASERPRQAPRPQAPGPDGPDQHLQWSLGKARQPQEEGQAEGQCQGQEERRDQEGKAGAAVPC